MQQDLCDRPQPASALWHAGKMLVYAAMLQCTDPLLTVAAALSHGRPVFMAPPAARDEAKAAHARIAGPTNGAKSDHVATVFAFNTFRQKRRQAGHAAARRWCVDNFREPRCDGRNSKRPR